MKNPSRTRSSRLKLEGNWSHKLKKNGSLQKSCRVCRLRNFTTCFASIFLLPFHHLFDFFLNCPFCIVGSLDIYVISLDSEHYISLSQALYKETTFCNKIGTKVSSFPAFLLLFDFLSLSFTFSPAKHSLRMTTQGMLG